MRNSIVFAMLFLASACAGTKTTKQDVGSTKLDLSNSGTTTCLLVEKPFVVKNGVVTDNMEMYLRCSVQDYYIKFCESDVTRKDLEKYLNTGVTVVMEIHDGEWDRCPGDEMVQSRVGTYVTIQSIE